MLLYITEELGFISILYPVSLAASLAFCPSLPIASESWSSGTIILQLSVGQNLGTDNLRRRKSRRNIFGNVFRVFDYIDFLTIQLVYDIVNPLALRADACADRIDVFVV